MNMMTQPWGSMRTAYIEKLYYEDPLEAIEVAKTKCRGTAKHMLISQTVHGYRIIDPRGKIRHYGIIVAKISRPLD